MEIIPLDYHWWEKQSKGDKTEFNYSVDLPIIFSKSHALVRIFPWLIIVSKIYSAIGNKLHTLLYYLASTNFSKLFPCDALSCLLSVIVPTPSRFQAIFLPSEPSASWRLHSKVTSPVMQIYSIFKIYFRSFKVKTEGKDISIFMEEVSCEIVLEKEFNWTIWEDMWIDLAMGIWKKSWRQDKLNKPCWF